MNFDNNRGDWYERLDGGSKGRIDYEMECIPLDRFYFFANVRGNIDPSDFFGAFTVIDKTKKNGNEIIDLAEDYHDLVTDVNSKVISRSGYNAYFINILVDPKRQNKTLSGLAEDLQSMGYEKLDLYATAKERYTISGRLKQFALHTLPKPTSYKI